MNVIQTKNMYRKLIRNGEINNMISKILEEVKSPFTDELIKGLIEKYIACGCDDKLFYSEINKLGNVEKTIGPYTR